MKKAISLVLAFAMILCLAACGGSNATNSDTADSADAADTSGDTSTSTPVNENTQYEAEANGVIADSIVMQVPEINSLGPFGAQANGAGAVSREVYQPLGMRNGFAGEFRSVMMDSWEEVDDQTWSVTIFDNIYDSENNHITADDVVFSWQECQRIGELTETFDVETITKTGDYTVEFHWGEPMSLGAFETMMSNVLIVSQAAYEASSDGMVTSPIGTGPYKVDSFVTGSSVDLSINENYWESEDQRDLGCEKQNVKEIHYQVLSESSQISMALQTGTIDISAFVNNEDLANFADGGAYSADYDVYSLPKTSGQTLCFNLSDSSPLHDENLRLAICYALNTDFLAAGVNGGNNEVNYCMGGRQYLDFQDEIKDMYYGYDLEKAKEYLAQSEYPNGCELNLMFMSGDSVLEDSAVIMQSQLEELGITLTIDAQQFGNYLANEGNPEAWDLTVCTFGADDYLTNAWKKYLDYTSTGTGMTKNFAVDETLQGLITTAASVDGHSDESVLAAWEYVNEHAYLYGLIISMDNIVYNSNLVSGLSWDNLGNLMAGGFVYQE